MYMASRGRFGDYAPLLLAMATVTSTQIHCQGHHMKGAPVAFIIALMMLTALVMACSTPELVRPSPTPTCLTALDEQYFDDLTGKVRSVGAITISMGEDWIAAGYDPSLLLDDIWVMRQETNIYVLEQLANDILALRAPSSAASVQKIATQMATDMQAAMEFFERGLRWTHLFKQH